MRSMLDWLYRVSEYIAALFIALIFIVVVTQVSANLLNWLLDLGLLVPSYAEFAGFFLAAASFFALAGALRAGSHIRVSLVLQRLPPGLRRAADIWAHALGAMLAGYFSWFMILLILESVEFGDVSPGIVPVPLWIPQSALAVGTVTLTIALVDGLITALRGDLAPGGDRLERG